MKVGSDAAVERPCAILPVRLLTKARILSKRRDIPPLLPKGGVFVEIGVAPGDYSAAIMENCLLDLFIAIDLFTIHEAEMIWGRPIVEVFGGKTHEAFYRDRFEDAIASDRMRLMAGDSSEWLAQLHDACVDVAYVDADHTFEFVREELALLDRKVSRAGWIVLNDYVMGTITGARFERYGVIQATHEFMIAQNWELVYLALHPKMHCDVALRHVS
jgi:hypothetical protein